MYERAVGVRSIKCVNDKSDDFVLQCARAAAQYIILYCFGKRKNSKKIPDDDGPTQIFVKRPYIEMARGGNSRKKEIRIKKQ